jgi:hypothetical protein
MRSADPHMRSADPHMRSADPHARSADPIRFAHALCGGGPRSPC